MKLLFLITTLLIGLNAQITPTSVTLASGKTQQFTAVCPVAGCSIHDWTIDNHYCPRSAVVGSISSTTGIYTAPTSVTTAQTVSVSVMLGDSFNACLATITLTPDTTPIPIPPTPTSITALAYGSGLIVAPNPSIPGTVTVSIDPTQFMFITLGANAGTTCPAFSISFDASNLLACIGGTWKRFVPAP